VVYFFGLDCFGYARIENMATEIEDHIEDNASGPKKAKGDSGEVWQHPLDEQIEADRYLASKKAGAGGSKKGFKLARFTPPGSL